MTEEKKIYVREFDPDLRAPQVIRDRNGTGRVVRYVGRCIVCVRPTFSVDDGDNDARTLIGPHANQGLEAAQHGMVGDDVVLCWGCNDDFSYNRGVWLAAHHYWQHPSDIAEDDENQYDSY